MCLAPRQSSFETLKSWVQELQSLGPENIVIALAGNKCDLADQRAVDQETSKAYAESIDAIFVETSAKTGDNVQEMFTDISKPLPFPSPPPAIRCIIQSGQSRLAFRFRTRPQANACRRRQLQPIPKTLSYTIAVAERRSAADINWHTKVNCACIHGWFGFLRECARNEKGGGERSGWVGGGWGGLLSVTQQMEFPLEQAFCLLWFL